jgi:SAM-dependent methyltransferase
VSVLKSIALAIPAIKRLRDDRDALAREAERLRKTVASRSSLQTEDPGVVARVGKLEPLDQIGLRNGTDKASDRNDFLRFYEPFLQSFRLEPVRVLEIGVLGGASVRTWRDYFPYGEIIGVDINPDAKTNAGQRISIELADQSRQDDMDRIAALGPFDLVIDDGSHVWEHQIRAFRTLMKVVKPGGLFILEDLDTSYGRYLRDYSGSGGTTAANYLFELAGWVIGQRQLREVEQLDPHMGAIWPTVASVSFSRGTAVVQRRTDA